MGNIFNQSQLRRPKKNKFNLSHDKKLSLQFAKLVPILLQEVLPGDRFKVNTEIMMRMAPMIAPIMHRVNIYTHYFFVPNRIVWNEWEDFITGGKDGTAAPVHPYINSNDATASLGSKSLADYMGFPTITGLPTINIKINALPFRGYTEIWNEFYRDQTLSNEAIFSKGSGQVVAPDVAIIMAMKNRCWEKDYFTSALPWPQRGPDVGIPLTYKPTSKVIMTGTGLPAGAGNVTSAADGDVQVLSSDARIENLDLTQSTIAALRRATRLQEWLEKNARGGARYIEQLLSHFGKAPRDARLQRPEYLGGGIQPMVISEVLSTVDNAGAGSPTGEMAGHGISVGVNHAFTKEFEEHGFVFGIMSVIPKTGYQQGVNKMFSRFDKLDYAWPEFAQIGEQAIQQQEIYYDGATGTPANTFGYTPRYSEYKYGCNTVHGEFRTTLDFWHLGRKFAAAPPLNSGFVEATPTDSKRIFAVTTPTTDDLYAQVFHNISALRPLPYYGTPSI